MLIAKFLQKLDRIAPQRMALNEQEYGFQIGPIKDFNDKPMKKGVLISVSPTIAALNYARVNGFHTLITRVPFFPTGKPFMDELMQKKAFLATSEHLRVFCLNTSFDHVENGINDTFAKALGLNKQEDLFLRKSGKDVKAGYIAKSHNKSIKIQKIYSEINRILKIDCSLLLDPECNKESIEKIAVCVTTILTPEDILTLDAHSCDCCITSGVLPYAQSMAKELGLSLIIVPFQKVAVLGLEKLSRILSIEMDHLEVACFFSK